MTQLSKARSVNPPGGESLVENESVSGDAKQAPRKLSGRALLLLVVSAFAIMIIFNIIYAWFPKDLSGKVPVLTLAELDTALAKWEQNGPDSYELEVYYNSTDQDMSFRIKVVDKEVVSGTRDGVTLSREAASDWTIPGQFERIRKDVVDTADPQQRLGLRENAYLHPRAVFDPEFGYPLQYELQGRGTPLRYDWEVTRFDAGTSGQ